MNSINHVKLITDGDIASVHVNIVIEVRNKKHLDVLLRSMIRAASLEEHRVSQMSEREIEFQWNMNQV